MVHKIQFYIFIFISSLLKIPHTGEKASLDRCGQQHRCHRRVNQECPKTRIIYNHLISQYNRLMSLYNRLISQYNRLMSLYNRLTETGPKNQQKKNNCAAIFDNFQTKMFKYETTSFHYFSPRIPNLYKILDIRLWEGGAKRPVNSTSKVNRQTDRRTDVQTDILTYRKHRPRGPML